MEGRRKVITWGAPPGLPRPLRFQTRNRETGSTDTRLQRGRSHTHTTAAGAGATSTSEN